MKHVKLGHLLKSKISNIKTFFSYLHEAMPIRLEAVHVLNVVPFIKLVLATIKPFISAQVLNKVMKIIFK